MTPVESLRAGIAGAGLMGRWHAESARRAGGRVVAVADPERAAADALAARHSGARAFSDVAELLRTVELDVLHVCTPLESHEPLVTQALAAGVHVLVEKPIAPDAAATERLLGRAVAARRIVCPVQQLPFQSGFRRALAGLESAGRLLAAEVTLCSAGGAGRDERDQGALLAELLPHPLSVAQVLFPAGIGAAHWQVVRPAPGELRVHTVVGGASFQATLSLASRPTEHALCLRCEHGTWHVDFFHGFAFRQPGAVSRGRKILAPFERSARTAGHALVNLLQRAARGEPAYPGLRTLCAELYAAVQSGTDSPIPAQRVLELARVRDELVASAGL